MIETVRIGTARRVHQRDAKAAFEQGRPVLVSEYGREAEQAVTNLTTFHTRETSSWETLVEQVRMWRGRYPNQRFYIVDLDEPAAEEVDVASLPDCGEDFMAGTICSLAEGHVDRDGTSHAAECRRCGVDWIKNNGCDCPPKDEDLPTVPLDDDGAPVDGFEIHAVKYLPDETRRTGPEDADAWGIYVIYDDAPSMHVEDYDTAEEAERIAAALATKHDVEWSNITPAPEPAPLTHMIVLAVGLSGSGLVKALCRTCAWGTEDYLPRNLAEAHGRRHVECCTNVPPASLTQEQLDRHRAMIAHANRENAARLDLSSSASSQHYIETGYFLTLSDTAEDRAKEIQQRDGMIGMSDQPTTCGKCGARTEYEDLADSAEGETRQLHTCRCGHEFVVESEREWDEHDEKHGVWPVPGCTYCPTEEPAQASTDSPLDKLRAATENDYESDVLAALIERAGLDLAPAG